MAKVSIKVKLDSNEEKLDYNEKAILEKNKITYKENDITVTILKFKNKIEMKRVCADYQINFTFMKSKSKCTYTVFGGSKTFDLSIKTNKLEIEENEILIDYTLEDNNFLFILEIGGNL